jgi:DNA uptake protein ComE-like DNA-binding protein
MQLLDINHAPFEELRLLPGVGKITARRIIANRPYDEPYDLVSRRVLGESIYEKNEQRLTVGRTRV